MDFFICDTAGEIVNCIVADSAEIAANVTFRVYGGGYTAIERKGESREVDIGDTLDKQARQFTKKQGGKKIAVPIGSAEAVAVSEVLEG